MSQQANDDFDITVMARTGQDGLTGIKSAPSVNRNGHVAFIANLTGNERFFFARDKQLTHVTPSFVGATFSTFFQLTVDGRIVARDGSGTSVRIGRWEASTPDEFMPPVDPRAGPARVCADAPRGDEPCGSEFDCLDWDNVHHLGCIPDNRELIMKC